MFCCGAFCYLRKNPNWTMQPHLINLDNNIWTDWKWPKDKKKTNLFGFQQKERLFFTYKFTKMIRQLMLSTFLSRTMRKIVFQCFNTKRFDIQNSFELFPWVSLYNLFNNLFAYCVHYSIFFVIVFSIFFWRGDFSYSINNDLFLFLFFFPIWLIDFNACIPCNKLWFLLSHKL